MECVHCISLLLTHRVSNAAKMRRFSHPYVLGRWLGVLGGGVAGGWGTVGDFIVCLDFFLILYIIAYVTSTFQILLVYFHI